MAEKEVNIKVKVDAKEAEQKMRGVQSLFTDLSKSITSFTDGIKSKFGEIAAGVAGAFAGIKGAFDISNDALKFKSAVTAMKQQFGQDADVIIKKLKDVSGNTLSMKDIVISANRAMALNVTKDVNVMAQLLEFARIRSKALGTTTSEAFNDIVTGIGRGSPMILDNLGIITKGWEEQAKATGKTYDSQFILNKVLEQAKDAMAKVSAETKPLGERMGSISAAMDDARLKLGEALIPVFEAVVPVIIKIINGFAELPDSIKTTTVAISIAIPAIIALNASMGPLGLALAGVGIAAVGAMYAFNQWKDATRSLSGELKVLSEEQQKAERAIKSVSLDAMAMQGINASEALKKANAELKTLIEQRRQLSTGFVAPGVMEELDRNIANVKAQIDALEKQIADAKAKGTLSPLPDPKTEKERLEKLKKFQEDYLALVVNSDRSSLQTRLASLQELEARGLATEKQLTAIQAEEAETRELISQEEMSKKLDTAKSYIGAVQQIENGISSILSGLSANRMQEYTNEQITKTNALQAQLDSGIISEEEFAKKKKALDKDIAQKKAEEERKLAEVQKGMRLVQIITDTASGIVSSFTPYIPILSEIRAGIVAGVGALQFGVAAAAPLPEIPAFAAGVLNFMGGNALVGENGPEVVNLPRGANVIPNNVAFPSFPMGDAISSLALVGGGSGGGIFNNQNNSRSVAFSGPITIVANDPQSFFDEMQRYIRDNQGIE